MLSSHLLRWQTWCTSDKFSLCLRGLYVILSRITENLRFNSPLLLFFRNFLILKNSQVTELIWCSPTSIIKYLREIKMSYFRCQHLLLNTYHWQNAEDVLEIETRKGKGKEKGRSEIPIPQFWNPEWKKVCGKTWSKLSRDYFKSLFIPLSVNILLI